MPSAAIDLFIIFKTVGSSRRAGFPSYSWTGWRGKLEWTTSYDDTEVNTWLERSAWICWTCSRGDRPRVIPTPLLQFSCYTTRRLDRIAHFSGEKPNMRPSYEVPAAAKERNYYLLHFCSLGIFYRMKIIDIFRGVAQIISNDADNLGEVWLDGFDTSTFFDSKDYAFEFILLSRSPYHYNVMLIEWVAPGLAERRGCGKIETWAVARSLPPGPIWKAYSLA